MNNNRNPDPVELAREVLQAVAEERQTALTGSTLDNSLAIEELFDVALSAAPALAHTVIAVAELHEPDHTYPDCPKCIHCSEMASSGTRRIAVLWPCDTVTAITTARDGIR